VERVELTTTATTQKAEEKWAISGIERQQLQEPTGTVQERRLDV
jgi:hypothetical protein